jgi:alkylated DNA nucleotide flippase Atl1
MEGKSMVMQTDEIVEIPEHRVKYFGTMGKMLLPSPATLKALIRTIPARQLLTTDLLRQRLAVQFKVEGVCPVTTRRSLKALAQDGDVTYWRVINQDGGLNADYPGGVSAHADHLRAEGFTIDVSGKKPKVSDYKAHLLR